MPSARFGRERAPAPRVGRPADGFEATTGRLNGLATLAGNWPSLVLIQTAVIAAQGSERFVKLALAAQSAGVVVVLVVMLALRRNLAGRWQLVASAWVGVVGMLIIAIRPDRATLLTVQQAYQAQIGHVAGVVLGRAQPINTPEEGIVLMNMVDGMYEAARTGRTVDLRTR